MREYSSGTLLEIGSGLDPELAQQLLNAGDLIGLTKGQTVYAQGEAAGQIFFLINGQAKSVLRNAEGNGSQNWYGLGTIKRQCDLLTSDIKGVE